MSTKNVAETPEAKAVSELIARARAAQKVAESYSQERVDELVSAICWEIICNDELVLKMSQMALDETELGDLDSKIKKLTIKCRGLLYDLNKRKSMGIVEELPARGLQRMVKPVGVICSIVPATQPEMIPVMQAMNAVKARDAIIFSPSRRGKNTTNYVVDQLRACMKKYDAPEDLFISLPAPDHTVTNELMKQADLIIATGGSGLVKSAYSSGTPAFGVGAGNAHIFIDESADLADAALKIRSSKTFDLAAGCSCDNTVIVHEKVYNQMLEEFKKVGAYIVPSSDKQKVQKGIWPNFQPIMWSTEKLLPGLPKRWQRSAALTLLPAPPCSSLKRMSAERGPLSPEKSSAWSLPSIRRRTLRMPSILSSLIRM